MVPEFYLRPTKSNPEPSCRCSSHFALAITLSDSGQSGLLRHKWQACELVDQLALVFVILFFIIIIFFCCVLSVIVQSCLKAGSAQYG